MPFTLTATNVPVPTCFTAVFNPATGPLTSKAYAQGERTNIRPYLNENAGRQDLSGRYGGGGNAVIFGLDLTAGTGLAVNVATGVANIDGWVTPTATSISGLTNGTRNHLWLSRDGTMTFATTTTPPGQTYCYLGSAVTAGGVVTSIDQSGVVYLKGGWLRRTTADATTPADTPPAQLMFVHLGPTKAWVWTGTEYRLISSGSSALTVAESVVPITGNTTLTQTQHEATAIRVTDGGGLAHGWVLTWPAATAAVGGLWAVRNDSGKSGQLTLSSGSELIYVNVGQNLIIALTDGELKVVGRLKPSLITGSDYVVSHPKTWTLIEQVVGDHFEYVPSGGNVTVNYPTAGALGARGMRTTLLNDHTTSYMLFQTNGAATRPDAQTYLLPGEIQGVVVKNDGTITREVTRPYTALASVSMGSDADKTVAHPDFLASIITVTSSTSLTATRNLILPTVADKEWYIRNNTTGGQKLTVKTSGGTGVTIQNGQAAWVYGDGTNILPGSPGTEHRTQVYPVNLLFGLVTAKSVGNPTTAETTLIDTTGALGTLTVPAAWFLPGRSLRVKASGVYSSAAGTTLNIRVKLGSTTILATGDQTPAAATDRFWEIDATISCRTSGATGTVMGESAWVYLVGGTGNLQAWAMVNTAAVTVDTTGTLAADLSADWGAGVAAGDTITLHTLTLELLG